MDDLVAPDDFVQEINAGHVEELKQMYMTSKLGASRQLIGREEGRDVEKNQPD